MPIPQYYFKDDRCKAKDAYSPDCICWRDEGTGPFPLERPDDPETHLTWRFKPPQPNEAVQKGEPCSDCILKMWDARRKVGT